MSGSVTFSRVQAAPPALLSSGFCRDESSRGLTAPLRPPHARTRRRDTSDGVRDSVSLGPSQPWNELLSPPRVCICDSARHLFAHFNAPKPLPSSPPGAEARRWWRAAKPHPPTPHCYASRSGRQLIIEPASLYTAQQSIINPFHSGLLQREANKDSIYEAFTGGVTLNQMDTMEGS